MAGNMTSTLIRIVFSALYIFTVVDVIMRIGEPRKPLTRETAVWMLAAAIILVWLIWSI